MATPPPPLSSRLGGVRSSPVRDILELTHRDEVISFAGGLPAPELFPAELIADASARTLAPTAAARALQYSSPEGDPGLPGCWPSASALAGCNAMAPRHWRRSSPSTRRSSSTSSRRSRTRRGARCPPRGARLAHVAAQRGLWIIEDDPYGELRYDGEPLAPIGSHPGAADRTVTISSLSKVLAPGMQIGWLRAPAAVLGLLTIAKQAADLHTSTVDQLAARTSLQADLDLHIAALCREYRRRRDALLEGLGEVLPPGSAFNRPDGGMFVWARLPNGWDAEELRHRALEHEVAFVPGHPFFAREPDPPALRLSFTTHVPQEIAAGLARLRRCWSAAG